MLSCGSSKWFIDVRNRSIAQLASGQLEKDVFQVGVAVQIAQVRTVLELRDDRDGILRVAEDGFAARFAALAQTRAVAARPVARTVAVHLDDLRLDIAADQLARRAGGH